MKYSSYMQEINDSLLRHKKEVDNLVMLHSAEVQANKEEVKKMQGVYTQDYIKQYIANWKPKTNYADEIRKSSEKTVLVVDMYLAAIKKQLDRYFNNEVRSDFANKINAISLTGLSLKDKEFKLLAESASNYMEMRLLQHLADSRTAQKNVVEINEKGYSESKEVTVKNPYFVELPDIDYTYRSYEDFAGSVMSMAKYYCGENAELKKFLGNVSEYAPLAASGYLKGHSLSKFTQAMEKANSFLLENKVKNKLTDNDIKFIDTIINPEYPSLAESKVAEIVRNGLESDLVELLRLDSRYGKIVERVENSLSE